MKRFRASRSILLGVCLFLLWGVAAVRADDTDPPAPEEGYVGFSTVPDEQSGWPKVPYVAAQSPAAEAGVQVDDRLIAIDHLPTAGRSLREIGRSIDGPVDTSVLLTLRRAGSPDREVSVTRRALLAVYTPAAEAGDPRAADCLGAFYKNGPMASRDLAKAVEWYRKAADGQYAPAQLELGYLTAKGLGVTKNLNEAAHWYYLAAKQGNAVAARYLGYCYLYGQGVRRSDENAFYYYDQSARQDDPEAEMHLGLLYRDGRGVARNLETAFAWFYRSAQQDDASAESSLGFLYLEGQGVAMDTRAAFAWFYRSAVRGNSYGAGALAYMYAAGKGTKRDAVEALRWYLKAEAQRPNDQELKQEVAMARLRAFLQDPRALSSLDLSDLPPGIKRWFGGVFAILAAFYAVVGLALLYANFRSSDATGKLRVAFGWLLFFLESQGVAFVGLCLFGKGWGANALVGATSAAAALPVILSSGCGPVRSQLWRPPALSAKRMLLCGLAALATIYLVMLIFEGIYLLVQHRSPPSQPTVPLLSQAKQTSAWLLYVSAALLLPVAEEILFRGYLFNALQRRFSDKTVVVLTALCFSAFHLQWVYFLPLAGFGMVLGWARLKSGSLWLPVFIHAANNSLAFYHLL